MKIAVVGSRTFNNYDFLRNKLSQYAIEKIISGGAKGADKLSERYAAENNIPIVLFFPDWKLLGRFAGLKRNQNIIKELSILSNMPKI